MFFFVGGRGVIISSVRDLKCLSDYISDYAKCAFLALWLTLYNTKKAK